LFTQPGARIGQPELDPAGVALVTGARNQPQPGQPSELERNGAGRHPHSGGELSDRQRFDGIELLQNAGEVKAEPSSARKRVTLTATAGRVDGGIGGQNSVDGILEHARNWGI
jgi:hypothetical protein